MKMSRDARSVLQAIEACGGTDVYDFDNVIEAEQLVYSYFGKTVVGHIKRFYNPNSTKGNAWRVAFYVQPVRSINKGKRNKEDWEFTTEEREVYQWVSKHYLIDDFNYEQLKQMREICQRPLPLVKEAIASALQEDTRNVPYLLRVLQGLEAERNARKAQREKLRDMFSYQEDKTEHRWSALDLAQAQYGWQQALENKKIEQEVKQWYERTQN